MGARPTGRWILGGAALPLAVLVLGWLLLIAPQRSEAAALREQEVAQQEANGQLRSRVAQLQAQAQDLPAEEARLAELRERVPAEPRLPELVTALSSAAQDTGVELLSLAPQPPQPVPLPAGAAAGTPEAPQLQQVPVTVTVRAGYFEAAAYLARLEQLPRSLLVSRVALTAATPEEQGAPGSDGRVEMVVDARAFLTAAPTSAAPTSTAPTATASGTGEGGQ